MSTISGEAGKGRYIIRSKDDGGQLTHFLSDVANDPDVSLLDTIGPVGQEHTAVFEMSHEKALFLAQRFRNSNQLMIEPDRPLSLFINPV